MKRLISIVLCMILLTAALPGCANDVGAAQNLSAQAAPEAPAALDLAPCGDFTPATGFGLKLFAETLAMDDGENPVISPVSAYLCLAMVMLGAEGETLSEFEDVLGGDMDTVASLAHDLSEKLMDTEGNTILNIANSLWADDDRVTVQESYIQSIVDHFDGEIYQADLPSREALNAINAWANEKTNGLIPTLHDEPYPDDTALVLLNSLYMKAKWERMFEGHATRDKTFTKADGAELETPFMRAHMEEQQYINMDGAEGVLLPYDDGKTAFVALRPTDGNTARDFAAALTAERLEGYVAAADDRLVNLSMPKFNLAYELYLTDALIAMGLESAFSSGADFAPMGSGANGPLYLSWVFQKVRIEVNEEGTEAAAVTEAAATEGAMIPPEEPIELHLNSPFVYVVIDLATGTPLFLGLLENPAVE